MTFLRHLRPVVAGWLLLAVPGAHAGDRVITVADYEARVAASWLGQIVGNVYGLGYEFRFIEEPGPARMPYGYAPDLLQRVRELGGAFSDDDTDIEYMYLLQMERCGPEPTYRQLADAWKHHVRERIWVANREALAHMLAGFYPPHTGRKDHNSQWFQIDPQLVNEIWAVTAPGMVRYAAGKADWAARITSDDFGVEPTVFYAALYAEAFFEPDVETLVERGLAALPPGSRFAATVRTVQELVRRYPDDWPAARRELAARYHREFDYNRGAWTVVDANLNGACAVMALLYGRGDVARTLDLACGIGFDADNQAATLMGLLGAARGRAAFPPDLLFPLPDTGWTEPFNDRYVNVTRHDLPDARISDLARRMAAQGIRVVLAQGGSRVRRDGEDCLVVPADAVFVPPFELNPPPVLRGALGEPLRFEFYCGRGPDEVRWEYQGGLPAGVEFATGVLAGVPREPGGHRGVVRATWRGHRLEVPVEVVVRGVNLAPAAAEILFNPEAADHDLALLRDGDRRERTYFSTGADGGPRLDHYGYRWNTPRTIAALRYSVGRLREFGGWFTSLEVEYRTPAGVWAPVRGLRIDPAPNLDNSQWLKGGHLDYDLSFIPVETTAIRIVGAAGGIPPDAANRHLGHRCYTAISELSVYDR